MSQQDIDELDDLMDKFSNRMQAYKYAVDMGDHATAVRVSDSLMLITHAMKACVRRIGGKLPFIELLDPPGSSGKD